MKFKKILKDLNEEAFKEVNDLVKKMDSNEVNNLADDLENETEGFSSSFILKANEMGKFKKFISKYPSIKEITSNFEGDRDFSHFYKKLSAYR